jgi:hypothetical protein
MKDICKMAARPLVRIGGMRRILTSIIKASKGSKLAGNA